ncbi:CCD69 protein, partial [Pygoscelis papua]
ASQVEKGKDPELEEQFNALRREHTETLQELQRAHEQEKLLLAESHHRSQAALQEKIQVLNSQLKSFQERMKRVEESLLSTDYKKHIQVQGDVGAVASAEGCQGGHLLRGAGPKPAPAVPPGALRGVEGVHGCFARRLQQCMPFSCRQLSEELLAARGALEKEAQLREQAHHEKEELLYRVLNGGDGSPFPIAASEVPLITT